jgi:hypothetical protein
MLRVGMLPVTLSVTAAVDAERPLKHSHAERGNDHQEQSLRLQGTHKTVHKQKRPTLADRA